MCNTMRHFLVLVILFLWNTATFSLAQSTENIAIHGFGGWAYGKTNNSNQYLAGTPDGSYDYLYFSLNIAARPYERVSLHVQPAFNENYYEHTVGIDYAFAEWGFSDALKLRIGKVIAPFMLYTEVYDVGTIRPFFFLPPSLYQELAAEAYSGIGITGGLLTNNDWEIRYDVYGGKLNLQPQRFVSTERLEFDSVIPTVHDMLGGRLLVYPPLDGVGFGLSAYRGDVDLDFGTVDLSDIYTPIGVSAEYMSSPWWFRSEYLIQRESSKIVLDIVYAEIAYQLTERWQIAARYEFADLDIPAVEAVYLESFLKHEEIVLGLNYWVNPSLVFKGAYHFVNGNRLAFPAELEDFLEQIQRGYFDEQTQLFSFGVQFSF